MTPYHSEFGQTTCPETAVLELDVDFALGGDAGDGAAAHLLVFHAAPEAGPVVHSTNHS